MVVRAEEKNAASAMVVIPSGRLMVVAAAPEKADLPMAVTLYVSPLVAGSVTVADMLMLVCVYPLSLFDGAISTLLSSASITRYTMLFTVNL